MSSQNNLSTGKLVHIVNLLCKDEQCAQQCIEALRNYGRPDAMACGCTSYDFGIQLGTTDTVYLIERWNSWNDLDKLLVEKAVPALPAYNALLKSPFDPVKDTTRIELED